MTVKEMGLAVETRRGFLQLCKGCAISPDLVLDTYLDESGTHDQSPVSVMAGYVGTSAQWKQFEVSWTTLVRQAGVQHIHAVDLFKRTKQFKGWTTPEAQNLALSLQGVIDDYLQVGFAVVVRDDDYKNIYGSTPHPKRLPKDTKYGVCFRACLAFAPSYIASEFRLAEQTALAQNSIFNFVLENGHRHMGDARRIFNLYKADALPEWKNFVGAMEASTKDSPGAQAADFLAYTVYQIEIREHGHPPSLIEQSSYVADTPLVANVYPRQPVPQKGPMLFRIPISRASLQSLKDDTFAIEAERRA